IAGIWPFGRGEVRLPKGARVLFLPQRPYLPIGTLRDVVSYPMPSAGVSDATLREALDAVGLPELGDGLDEAAHWAQQLSPGQQRGAGCGGARDQRPEWLFLEGATRALEELWGVCLYRRVRARLADTRVFSSGHGGTRGAFPPRRLTVELHDSAPASIVET